MIREAVDEYVADRQDDKQMKIIDKIAGIWKNRTGVIDYEEVHKNWDRKG